MPPKPTLKELYERKKEVSGQVSTQTRTYALSLLAISWGLLTAHEAPLQSLLIHVNRHWLLGVAGASIAVIILDMLQYVAATTATDVAIRKATANYDDKSFSYRAIGWCYRAKSLALIVGAAGILIVLVLMFAA